MPQMNYDFVLDCSATMAWCFEDERTSFTDTILDSLEVLTAIVPSLWSLEVANVLLIAQKNKRITEIQVSNFIDALHALPIEVDHSTPEKAMHSIYVIAKSTNITIYDACYLELAVREKIPLITLDEKLKKAAKKIDVPIKLAPNRKR